MTDAQWVFVLATLYNVGKAGAHATRGIGMPTSETMSWARTPMIDGLPLSDLYHAFSGVQWLLVLAVCNRVWGHDWMWWVPAAIVWGTIWPASKLLKGLSIRRAIMEAWYVQIVVCLKRKV